MVLLVQKISTIDTSSDKSRFRMKQQGAPPRLDIGERLCSEGEERLLGYWYFCCTHNVHDRTA
jgi:hypothetical protein